MRTAARDTDQATERVHLDLLARSSPGPGLSPMELGLRFVPQRNGLTARTVP
jgi:hypothetical protein